MYSCVYKTKSIRRTRPFGLFSSWWRHSEADSLPWPRFIRLICHCVILRQATKSTRKSDPSSSRRMIRLQNKKITNSLFQISALRSSYLFKVIGLLSVFFFFFFFDLIFSLYFTAMCNEIWGNIWCEHNVGDCLKAKLSLTGNMW